MQNASQRKPCNAPFNASFNAPFNTSFNAPFNIPFNSPSTPLQHPSKDTTPLQTKHSSNDNNNLDFDILKKDKYQ